MADAMTVCAPDPDPLTCVLLSEDGKKYPVTSTLLTASDVLAQSLVDEMDRRAKNASKGSKKTGFGNEMQTPIPSHIMDIIMEWCARYENSPARANVKGFGKYETLDAFQQSLFTRVDADGMQLLSQSAAYLKITLLTRFAVLAMCMPTRFSASARPAPPRPEVTAAEVISHKKQKK
jgi:hypothetical protein